MSSTHYSIIAVLVPRIIKKAVPFIVKKFQLREFDMATRKRITAKTYPRYYAFLYAIWILLLLLSGIIFFFFLLFSLPSVFSTISMTAVVWIALINMIGGWLFLGAVIDVIFWAISSVNFKDYTMFRQMKSGSPHVLEDQFRALFVLAGLYYAVMFPVILLIFFLSK